MEHRYNAFHDRRAGRACHVVTKERRFSRTQTMVSKFCSSCGYCFGDEEHREMPFPGVLGKVKIPNYCPNCGAKVVDEWYLMTSAAR